MSASPRCKHAWLEGHEVVSASVSVKQRNTRKELYILYFKRKSFYYVEQYYDIVRTAHPPR